MTASISQALISTDGAYKVVKSTKEKPLALVHDIQVQVQGRTYSWLDCSLRIHSSEEASLNFERVMGVIVSGVSLHPSFRAGIDKNLRSLPVQHIDDLFDQAIDDYRTTFEAAMKKDMVIFDGKSHQIEAFCLNMGWIGRFFAQFAPLMTKAIIGTSKLEREGSRHRVMWLKEVDTKEALRIENSKDVLINQSRLLHRQSQESIERSLMFDEKDRLQLEQLYKVHKIFFPDRELIVDDAINIGQYLDELK